MHPNFVEGYNGSLDNLILELRGFSCGQKKSFLDMLGMDLSLQAFIDATAGRGRVAKDVANAAAYIFESSKNQFCDPLMFPLSQKYTGDGQGRFIRSIGNMDYESISYVLSGFSNSLGLIPAYFLNEASASLQEAWAYSKSRTQVITREEESINA